MSFIKYFCIIFIRVTLILLDIFGHVLLFAIALFIIYISIRGFAHFYIYLEVFKPVILGNGFTFFNKLYFIIEHILNPDFKVVVIKNKSQVHDFLSKIAETSELIDVSASAKEWEEKNGKL